MKTKIALFAIMVCAVLTGACVGVNHLGVLDESVPEEQRCFLEVRNDLSIIMFNNQPVKWESEFTKDKFTIYLPPGENTFLVTYVEARTFAGVTTYDTISNTVSMEFLPGHSYRIYKQKIWLLALTITSIKIKDMTPKKA